MKNKIKKVVREIIMLSIAFACGLFIFIGIMSVYATWDSPENNALTRTDYDNLVTQVKSWSRVSNNVTFGVSGNLNMDNKKITGLPIPTNDSDAATKKYVDDNAGGSLTNAISIGATAPAGSITITNNGTTQVNKLQIMKDNPVTIDADITLCLNSDVGTIVRCKKDISASSFGIYTNEITLCTCAHLVGAYSNPDKYVWKELSS